jgi:hypothetical protein
MIPQRQSPICVSDAARQFLDISDKPVRSIDYGCEIHPTSPGGESRQLPDS